MSRHEFYHNSGDTYHITGVTTDNKRFKIVTSNPHHALGINLWRGSLWQVRNGKRSLMQRTWN